MTKFQLNLETEYNAEKIVLRLRAAMWQELKDLYNSKQEKNADIQQINKKMQAIETAMEQLKIN